MAKFTTSQTFSDGDQVTSSKLDNIIANLEFSADAVANTTLTVVGGQLKVGTITVAEMGANSVGTSQLVNLAVTPGKLSTGGPSWDTSGNLTITGDFSNSAADDSPSCATTNTSSVSARFPNFTATNYSSGTAGYAVFDGRLSRGSQASPAAIQTADVISLYRGSGWDGSGFFPAGGTRVVASETWSGSARGNRLELLTTPNGSTTPQVSAQVSHGGNFGIVGDYYINDVKVVGERATGWSASTGTATRTAFATSTVTTEQLAQRVKALIDDLIAHGLIGS